MKRIIIVVIVTLFLVTSVSACSTGNLTDDEKNLLITLNDVEKFGISAGGSSEGESFLKNRNLDCSIELEYEYDSEKDPASTGNLWLKSVVEIYRTVPGAQTAYKDTLNAIKLGTFFGSKNVDMREDKNLFVWGNDNFGTVLEKNSVKLGNIILTRKGNTIFILYLAGFYFDDPRLLHDLIVPKLEKAVP